MTVIDELRGRLGEELGVVPVGARLRLRLSLEGMTEHPDGTDVTLLLTFESSADERPVCVAEMVTRLVAAG